MTVRLVDGGVHDNQGIASLLEQACSVMLVSDASGQMGTQEDPPGGPDGRPAPVVVDPDGARPRRPVRRPRRATPAVACFAVSSSST